MLRKLLEQVLSGHDLTSAETASMLEMIASGQVPPVQSGAMLAALRAKGESVSELVGGAGLLRRHARFIDCGGRECVDIVGTGGDGGRSFNISTTAALVAAGAGAAVAKHGGSAVSGKSGAADLLAELGFNLDAAPERIEECIALHGIGFMFAKKFHSLMGKVAVMRSELGIRTIFNLLGPLANPAGVRRMVVGVCDAGLTELFAMALRDLGVTRALIVHGHDGLDEISCCEPTRVTELADGAISSRDIYPELLIGESYSADEIAGGTPRENAEITRNILSGRDRGACRAVVVLNAAAAIYVAGLADSLAEAIPLAERSIDDGAASEKLEQLISESRR